MPAIPERIGPYRVLRELGRGGMGVVYEVERDETGGRFALKTLTLGLGHDPELAARFVREGQLAARLDHLHVVRTHAAAFEGDQPWIVQDLLPGGSLHDRLRASGPLPVDEAVEVVRKVALGLAHAHERGVLHRDVKPENVLFDDEGEPRLVDFGVARPTVGSASGPLTATGQVIGSPAFMAPEQAIGDPVDARVDVHAAGALLHTLLSGDPPFTGKSTLEVLEAVISKAPRPLRALRPEVPEAVERVVLRALAKRPDDRFPSASALAVALGVCRGGAARPASSRLVPALLAASVASMALAASALFFLFFVSRGATPAPPAPPPPLRSPATTAPLAVEQAPTPAEWPGWGPTFAAPTTFELVREGREDTVDTLTLTLEAQPARPSAVADQATLAMTVSRVQFAYHTGMVSVAFDSADVDRQQSPDVRRLIEGTLAARLSVELVLRTGEVKSVRGMPNVRGGVVKDMVAEQLNPALHDVHVLNVLHNTLHLFPDAPGADTLETTTWLLNTFGASGLRRVKRGEGGDLEHVLVPRQPKVVFMPGYTIDPEARIRSAEIRAHGKLDGDRVVSSELEYRVHDQRGASSQRFRFRLLAPGR